MNKKQQYKYDKQQEKGVQMAIKNPAKLKALRAMMNANKGGRGHLYEAFKKKLSE